MPACVGEVACFFFPYSTYLDRVSVLGLGCVRVFPNSLFNTIAITAK